MTAPPREQQWKCGNEFAPYHPQASHVSPDYRDGWNACYAMASAAPPAPARTVQEIIGDPRVCVTTKATSQSPPMPNTGTHFAPAAPDADAVSHVCPMCDCNFVDHALSVANKTIVQQARELADARATLAELVACKDLKDLTWRMKRYGAEQSAIDEYAREYAERKYAAWNKARAAIDAAKGAKP